MKGVEEVRRGEKGEKRAGKKQGERGGDELVGGRGREGGREGRGRLECRYEVESSRQKDEIDKRHGARSLICYEKGGAS